MMKKIMSIIMFLVTLTSFSGVAWATEIDDLRKDIVKLRADYESKIKKLEAQIDKLSRDQERKVAQIEEKIGEGSLDVEYVGRYEGPFKKGGFLIKNQSGFGNVSVGGYADIEYEDFQNSNSTFDQHRWVINIGAELSDRLRFYSEYEIEHGGPNSANNDGEAKVEQAWIDYLVNDGINFRAGALLVPFGRYNIYHDSDLQDLTERPLVARDIIPTTWTESGAGFWGEFNPTIGDYEDLLLGYETYIVNGLDNGFSDTGMGNAKGSLETDNNNSKAVVGRLVISPAIGHEIGLSGYWGRYSADRDDAITGGAVDWLSTWGPLEVVGEAAHFDVDPNATDDIANYFTGYHIQANYHFWPEFLNSSFLGRNFDDPAFTLVARHGWATIDDDDNDSATVDNEEDRWTLGLNYRPIESGVLKLEYIWSDTDAETLEKGNNDGFIASVALGF